MSVSSLVHVANSLINYNVDKMSMWIWKLNIDGNSLKRKLALKRCGQLWSLQLIFQEVPFCVLWKWHFPKNTVIIRLMSLFGSYILGIIFFHVKIKIIDDFKDEFLICKWQVYKIFFLTSWTWTKNGVLNFKCTTFKLHSQTFQ